MSGEPRHVSQQDAARLAKQIDRLGLDDPKRFVLQNELDGAFVPNVCECRVCHTGTVDRWGQVIQCRDCAAIGDTNTFIMHPPRMN